MSSSIYNGSAGTASLTHKILAGNGNILNSFSTALTPPPLVSTLAATKTAVFIWVEARGIPGKTDGSIAASVRIVSNVAISATLSHDVSGDEIDWKSIVCSTLQP